MQITCGIKSLNYLNDQIYFSLKLNNKKNLAQYYQTIINNKFRPSR